MKKNKGCLSIIFVFVHFYIFTPIYLHIDLLLCTYISKTGGPNIGISPDWLHQCNPRIQSTKKPTCPTESAEEAPSLHPDMKS